MHSRKDETLQDSSWCIQEELKKFGDLITFDAVDTSKVHYDVLVLEKEVLVVRDCFTGIIGAYPSDRMTKDDVVRAVKQFIGARRPDRLILIMLHNSLKP